MEMKKTPFDVIYIGKTDPVALINGKKYEVLSVEEGWYRVIDEEGYYEDMEPQGYLYPPMLFSVIE